MNQLLTPTGQAGVYAIPALIGPDGKPRVVQLVEWREGAYFDTVQLDLAPTAGKTYYYFRDLTNKNLAHTNFKTQRKIPDGSELIMSKIGILPNQALGDVLPTDADVIKLVYGATLEFKIGTRLIAEGPLYQFASGYGVTGSTTRNNTGIATVGVASTMSVAQLLVAQSIVNANDLDGLLKFEDNGWINGGNSQPIFSTRMGVTLLLHGLIKRAQGS